MKPIVNKRHMARVAELPCSVCHRFPVHVHHSRDMELCGAAQKSSSWYTMPLCHECHRELHADKGKWEMTHGSQVSHVEKTLDRLYGD